MKLYYDRINRKQTGIFRNADETIISTDDRVKCFWETRASNEDLAFDENGLPYVKTYAMQADGTRYSHYLDTPDNNGIYQPDTVKIDADAKARLKLSLEQVVQSYLDGEAQKLGYDNIVSACTYASASNPFQEEGQSFVSWRGNVWKTCYQILEDVEAGIREVPTEAELLAELPTRI